MFGVPATCVTAIPPSNTKTRGFVEMAAAAISAIRKSTASATNGTKHELLSKLPEAEFREIDIELGMLLTG
jgi:hypothetical protein